MGHQSPPSRGMTAFYQDYFQHAFAAADFSALWWQPLLKGIGRSQLELAGLQSRNAQAVLQWGRAFSASRTPMDLVTANIGLWKAFADNAGEAMPKISAALSQVGKPPAAFEAASMSAKISRDTLVIPGLDLEPVESRDYRHVA